MCSYVKMITNENPADSLVRRIYDATDQRGLSRRQLAELASVHVNTLKRFGKPGWYPAFPTLHKIAAVLLAGEGQPPSLDQGQQLTSDGAPKHRNVVAVKPNVKR
jgi:hypothetical protein